jgi:hypothetical protein
MRLRNIVKYSQAGEGSGKSIFSSINIVKLPREAVAMAANAARQGPLSDHSVTSNSARYGAE